jgi:hypothetical protein
MYSKIKFNRNFVLYPLFLLAGVLTYEIVREGFYPSSDPLVDIKFPDCPRVDNDTSVEIILNMYCSDSYGYIPGRSVLSSVYFDDVFIQKVRWPRITIYGKEVSTEHFIGVGVPVCIPPMFLTDGSHTIKIESLQHKCMFKKEIFETIKKVEIRPSCDPIVEGVLVQEF